MYWDSEEMDLSEPKFTKDLKYINETLRTALEKVQPLKIRGRVIQAAGTMIRSTIAGVKIGEMCIIKNPFEFTYICRSCGFHKK